MKPALLIIGLDGATFDVIDPMIEAGELPNLASLSRRGARAMVLSTVPSATFPAWSTFMTGANPGKHGIFDFTEMLPGTYRLRFVNAARRRLPSIFRIASDAGKRVGVLALPATYPPERLNGFMLSGFDAPVTTGTDSSFCQPRSLFHEIRSRFGGFPITEFQEFRIEENWHAKAFPKLLATLDRKTEIACHLARKERWDLFMALFGESDTVSHHFWMFHDPESPRHDPARRDAFGHAVATVYRRLDEAVGRLIKCFPPEAHVMVLSDHGFGGAGTRVLHINRALADAGLLRLRDASLGHALVDGAKRLGLRWLPPRLQEQVFRRGRGALADRMESAARFGAIDFSATKAFSEEMSYFPTVRINLRDRAPGGTVAPHDYDAVCRDAAQALLDLKDPETGEAVVSGVYHRSELYHGPHVRRAPDLILDLALEHGYSTTCLPTRGRGALPAVRRLQRPEFLGGKGRGMNGTHRREGIFYLAGPKIEGGKALRPIDLADAAPTALSILGLPVPDMMEGSAVGFTAPKTGRRAGPE